MKISINIPDEAAQKLLAGSPWSGSVKAKIDPETSRPDRRAGMAAELSKVDKAERIKQHFLSAGEREVRDAWNNSIFISETAVGESRNNPITSKQLDQHLRTLRRAITLYGGPEMVIEEMGRYFRYCARHDHLWDGSNHGYSHLGGFLTRLVKAKSRGGTKPLWMKRKEPKLKDDNAGITRRLADAFAAEILGRKSFGLINPSREYVHFLRAAVRVRAMLDSGGLPWTEDEACVQVCRCLKAVYSWQRGGIGTHQIAGKDFWSVRLPQWVKEHCG